MGEHAGDQDYGEEIGVFLGGGPVLEGVDYEAAWLEARAAADSLNAVLGRLGLRGPALVRAQAGWADDGRGVVFLEGTPLGARRLGVVLERMMKRGRWAQGSIALRRRV
ncbi:hypothetical protein ACIQGZ_29120 [Streptomyces sp. NPDC092296]|uniref:hypothetical protein n=1 Tax=Streptomyces sp. NPDC092296 TaxID=3366012 RepID=UPI0038224BFE